MSIFLRAEWRKLAMANYAVDPAVLAPYVPANTELDLWQGTCYVSLVGFMFLDTRVKGIRVPFHVNLEEVNLRFYVRYNDRGEWKRGVVFIKEIVPRAALTFVANTLYNENYVTMPMRHVWHTAGDRQQVAYSWKTTAWHSLSVTAGVVPGAMEPGSEEEFIAEHYWGYTKVSGRRTSEYAVEHPPWNVYNVYDYNVDVPFGKLYGPAFQSLSRQAPRSVLLAEGSDVVVRKGRDVSGPKFQVQSSRFKVDN